LTHIIAKADYVTGQKSAEKIKSILQDGFLQRNFEQQEDSEAVAFATFNSAWGIGPHRSQRWVAKGHRSIEDVLADQSEVAILASRERAGLVHAKDLNKRIPREVLFLNFVICLLSALFGASWRYSTGRSDGQAILLMHCSGHHF
jgi:hypothetical protein